MGLVLLKSPLYTGTNLEVIRESGGISEFPTLFLKGKIQEADTPNNNGRRYKYETLVEKIINARCTPELLRDSPLFGENIHPSDDLTGEINTEKVIWRVVETTMEGNSMVGTLEIIPETPLGKILYFLVDKYNAKPGISSRAWGSMNEEWVDHDSFKFVTFDGTFNPSTHGAFLRKIGESGDVREMIKSFKERDLRVLSESSMLRMDDGHSLVEKVFNNKHFIINNRKDMTPELELLKEANQQVSNLTKQLAESNSALKEETKDLATAEDKLIQLQEENEELTQKAADMQKELDAKDATIKEMEDAMAEDKKAIEEDEVQDKVDAEEKEKLEENYNKSLKVLEGVVSEFHKVKGFYNKSIEVLNLLESKKSKKSIVDLVESELGKFAHYKPMFESVDDLGKAKVIVESLKKIQSGKRPLSVVPLTERSVGNTDRPFSTDEQRINSYSI